MHEDARLCKTNICAQRQGHARTHTEYLEIQQSIQLVLNDGQRLNQFLCVHGAHHTVNPDKKGNAHTHTHTRINVGPFLRNSLMQMLMQTPRNRNKELRNDERWETEEEDLHFSAYFLQ